MTCEDFLGLVPDLARGGERLDSAARHCLDCQACAMKLAEQRELTSSLRLLANSDELLEAPMAIEQQLLDAFRMQSRNRSVLAWPAIAAAASVILAILTLWTYSKRINMVRVERPKTPAVAINPQASGAPPCCPEPSQQTPRGPSGKTPQRQKRAAMVQLGATKSGESRSAASAQVANDRELTTDFFAFPYGDALEPITGGQIVRIRLPRSALRAVGLPVNEERVAGEVDADVVLGEDMAVRAIRFVK